MFKIYTFFIKRASHKPRFLVYKAIPVNIFYIESMITQIVRDWLSCRPGLFFFGKGFYLLLFLYAVSAAAPDADTSAISPIIQRIESGSDVFAACLTSPLF